MKTFHMSRTKAKKRGRELSEEPIGSILDDLIFSRLP